MRQDITTRRSLAAVLARVGTKAATYFDRCPCTYCGRMMLRYGDNPRARLESLILALVERAERAEARTEAAEQAMSRRGLQAGSTT